MSELSYAVRAMQTLEALMERIEALEAMEDADIDMVDGVLTVQFDTGGQIIINRQAPLEQLWVASPLGPAHFSFDPNRDAWLDDRTGEELIATLNRALGMKLGCEISL